MTSINKTLHTPNNSSESNSRNGDILSKFGAAQANMENQEQIQGSFEDSPKRSLLKTMSWRVVGSVDTLVLAAFILGDISQAAVVMGADFFVKMGLYFVHERVWNLIPWGRVHGTSHARSVVKAISWRVVGTLSTIVVAFFTGASIEKSLAIGGVEVITKFILYYFHERAWTKVKWGRVFKEFKEPVKA